MKLSAVFGFVALVVSLGAEVSAAPQYEILPLGLDGLEHTHSDGYRSSSPDQLNEAGQVTGYSARYNGGGEHLGLSAWFYDGTTTINVGLFGPGYTSNTGYRETTLAELNEAGQVAGYSARFSGGGTHVGTSAWFYNGATTIDIGLTGPEYTRADGNKESYVYQLNEAGQVRGTSDRYNGNAFMGESAWLYNGATTIVLGLTGTEYTRNDGYKFSRAGELNESGQVVGYSQRYNGGSDWGESAWRYDGVTTIALGLTGPEYTRNDGYKSSGADYLNEAGQVAGYSGRYSGSFDIGQSAWLYNGATTINIGLTGPEHTHDGGSRSSGPKNLNELGQVAGYSYRYNGGSTLLGSSTWLYNGVTTIVVGLTGTEYTRNDGYKVSAADYLNEAGQVAGYSGRYSGNASLGFGAWLYNGATTVGIGLTDPDHTRSNGYRLGIPRGLNTAGQVWGESERYYLDVWVGNDSWFYDPMLDQTFPLLPPIENYGHTGTYVQYLGDDGLVLGSYDLFDGLESYLGSRAFYFTVVDGLHDLGPLVDGGLAAHGWDYLADAIRANGLGQIIGYGALTGGGLGTMAYLLTPVSIPGDYNNDGTVNAADYTVWRNHLGQTFTLDNERPDAATPGVVDQEDYNFWKLHFGETAGSGSSAAAESTNTRVPEPSSLFLAAVTAIGRLTRRRTRVAEFVRIQRRASTVAEFVRIPD
jgi:hypothetical protein